MKRVLILFLKLAITAGAVGYLFLSGKLRLGQLAIEPGGWPWICVAALLCLALMLVSQVRYWLLLSRGGVAVGPGRVIRIGFISWFFNATLLGGLGFLSGDAIKIGYLMRESDRRAAIFGATLLDRLLGVMGLITLAVFALQIGWNETVQSPELRQLAASIYATFAGAGLAVFLAVIALAKGRAAALATWVVLGGFTAVFLARVDHTAWIPAGVVLVPLAAALAAPALLPGRTLHDAVVRRLWMGDRVGAFITALLEYRKRGGTLLAGYALSIAGHVAGLFILYFIGRAISLEVEPTLNQIWFAAPPVTALSVLPLPASGLGVGEAAFDAMLGFCVGPDGVPLRGGAALFLSYRILMTLLGLSGLLFYLTAPGRVPSER